MGVSASFINSLAVAYESSNIPRLSDVLVQVNNFWILFTTQRWVWMNTSTRSTVKMIWTRSRHTFSLIIGASLGMLSRFREREVMTPLDTQKHSFCLSVARSNNESSTTSNELNSADWNENRRRSRSGTRPTFKAQLTLLRSSNLFR